MRLGKEVGYDNLMQRLLYAANWVIRVIGAVIFLGLAWYAFRYTQYINPGEREIPINIKDALLKNLLCLVIVVALLFGVFLLESRVPARIQTLISRCMLVVSMLWIAGAGFWWITTVDRQPVGDQAFIYGGASMFIEGNYVFLAPRGYCGMYPHQLNLIFLIELLFLLVGTYNYFACQVICVIFSVGIVYQGYKLVHRITGHMLLTAAYSVMMMGCLPMIFYSGWVYGDVPSVFFVLLAVNMLLSYQDKRHWGYLASMVISMLLAIMVRKNSLILLIALCLVAGVYALIKKDRKLVLALFFAIICPVLVNAGISKMYEVRSGYEHVDGISPFSHIGMGLLEVNNTYGWYSDYSKEVYWAAECDTVLAGEMSKADIKERLKYFAENPDYAWTFFREKILSQWNQPLYQSLYFSNEYMEGQEPEQDTFVARISTDYFVEVLAFCDRLQFIIYVGIVCYFLFAIKKDSNILQHLLAVGMIGGFFFSIMWEAKARYVLPYYLMMYPMAIVGFWNLFRGIMLLAGRFRSSKEDGSVIEFREAA